MNAPAGSEMRELGLGRLIRDSAGRGASRRQRRRLHRYGGTTWELWQGDDSERSGRAGLPC